jgi:diguanylate cyclase (GGDEF)-like protein
VVVSWKQSWLRSFVLPSVPILGGAYLILEATPIRAPAATLMFYLYAICLAGLLLGWRFRASRVVGALLLFLLAHQALRFFVSGSVIVSGPGRTALEAISFLIPLNILVLAYSAEKGFSLDSWGPKLILLFLESVFVAVICRPRPAPGADLFHGALLSRSWFAWTPIPQVSLLAIAVTFCILAGRFGRTRHPIDAAFAWGLLGASAGMGSGGASRVASGLFASACLILVVSVLENSYRMAYYDELTGIPGRRAFNDALVGLQEPYSIAVVDIDHFKSFNDAYGHDTGDDVLRMVARKLSDVSGGGKAYRVGGEEFCLIFAGRTVDAVFHDLEALRQIIENSEFRIRASERRTEPRGPERRRSPSRRRRNSPTDFNASGPPGSIFVTISMGVAQQTAELMQPRDVINAADGALYQAKQNGRNRVECAGGSRRGRATRKRKASASIA